MTRDEFLASVEMDGEPPASLSDPLRALWHAAKGDWGRAHAAAQEIPGRDGSWIHAHLHREEGDLGNARHWYARSGRPEPSAGIEAERMELIAAFL